MTYITHDNPNRDFDLGFHSFRTFPVALSSFFDHELDSFARRFEVGEENDNLTLTLELPGFKQSEIDVKLEKGILTVAAKNARNEVSQSITVGSDIDGEKVEAKLEDGILTLTLPKLESAKPRKIAIK